MHHAPMLPGLLCSREALPPLLSCIMRQCCPACFVAERASPPALIQHASMLRRPGRLVGLHLWLPRPGGARAGCLACRRGCAAGWPEGAAARGLALYGDCMLGIQQPCCRRLGRSRCPAGGCGIGLNGREAVSWEGCGWAEGLL
eukprot:360666-Chlamydomonas_euryale.AAC.5